MMALLPMLLGLSGPAQADVAGSAEALVADSQVSWFDAFSMTWQAGRLSELPQGSEFILDGQRFSASGGGGLAWLGPAPQPWELFQADRVGARQWELDQAPPPRAGDWVYALVEGRHQPLDQVSAGDLVSYGGKVWLVDGAVLRETGLALHRVQETHERPPTPTLEMTVQGPGGVGSFVGADHPFYVPSAGLYRDMARIEPGEALWALGEEVEVVEVEWTGDVESLFNLTIGAAAHDFVVWGDVGGVLTHNCPGKGRTEPTLPDKVIAKDGGVTIEHYFRGGDHAPAHAHVIGGGTKTKIGPLGFPIKGSPALSAAQRKVITANSTQIRRSINKIGRWLDYHGI